MENGIDTAYAPADAANYQTYAETTPTPDWDNQTVAAPRGYAGNPVRNGRVLSRCNLDTHYFACKHETQCDCGMTQRVPLPEAGL